MTNLYINSIYLATEGEGVNIGRGQVFVRFQGCAVGCLNCDSKDTWAFPASSLVAMDDVVGEVLKLSQQGRVKWVSITGGDPLNTRNLPGVRELVHRLKKKGFFINLEAAGNVVDDTLFDLLDFVSFDIKTPSTGASTPMENVVRLVEQYQGKAQIKAVVETPEDFEFILQTREGLFEHSGTIPWVITPSYNPGEKFPLARFQWIIEENQKVGTPFRVIGQQHKWVFGPDQKQV